MLEGVGVHAVCKLPVIKVLELLNRTPELAEKIELLAFKTNPTELRVS